MDKPMSAISFKLMGLMFKLRDLVRPRSNILKETGIKPGFRVLDYGCGPGSYISALAEMIGPSGQIYALDVHPLAVSQVRKIADRKGLKNVETIKTDCETGLPDNKLDTVLMYDTFHDLTRPGDVLRELHRVLKPEGVLSFCDHHMKEEDVLESVTGTGLFKLIKKGENTYSFSKSG